MIRKIMIVILVGVSAVCLAWFTTRGQLNKNVSSPTPADALKIFWNAARSEDVTTMNVIGRLSPNDVLQDCTGPLAPDPPLPPDALQIARTAELEESMEKIREHGPFKFDSPTLDSSISSYARLIVGNRMSFENVQIKRSRIYNDEALMEIAYYSDLHPQSPDFEHFWFKRFDSDWKIITIFSMKDADWKKDAEWGDYKYATPRKPCIK